jgi:outer membrane immunogenic protein
MKTRIHLFLVAGVLVSIFLFTGVASAQKGGAYDWSGYYLGLNLGGGSMKVNEENTANNTAWGDMMPGQSFHKSATGVIGGGQFGFNLQLKQFVFGVEATTKGTSLIAKYRSSFNDPSGDAGDDDFKARVTFLMSVTGRIGYAMDKFLFYGKGGYAGAEALLSVTDNIADVRRGNITGRGTDNAWLSGWTVGAGVEYAITKHLIAGIEYNYIDLGGTNVDYGNRAGAYSFDTKIKDFHEFLAKLSYKFDW